MESTAANHNREVSLLRLYVLRAMYLTLVLGLGIVNMPAVLRHPVDANGVVNCLLAGIWLLAFVGLRYPLQMVPLLLLELAWKTIWVIAYGLPKLAAGPLDPTASANMTGTLVGVILMPLVIPWGYVWRHYVLQRGDRWGDRHSVLASQPAA
jgi:hypothetical protein